MVADVIPGNNRRAATDEFNRFSAWNFAMVVGLLTSDQDTSIYDRKYWWYVKVIFYFLKESTYIDPDVY